MATKLRHRKLLLESLEQRQLLSASPFPKALLIPLNTAGIGSLSGKLVTPGEVDPFKFTAPLTGTLVIREVSGPGTVYPTNVNAYAATGTPIASIYSTTPGQPNYWLTPGGPYVGLTAIDVTKGSVYYVTAAATSGCTGPYSVQITPDDVGNTFAMATTVSLISGSSVAQGGSGTEPGKIEYPGDVDIYTFQATVTGNMTIAQVASASNINSELSVYDATQTLMKQVDGTTPATSGAPGGMNASVTVPVVQGTWYYVQAAAFGSTTGAYLLKFSTLHAPNPAVPGVGHTFATATPVLITPDPANAGTVTTQTGTIGFSGDVDYYSFVAATTGQMTIRQNADTASGSTLDSHLYIYNANQQLIWQNDDSGIGPNGTVSKNSLVSIPVAAGMTYYAEAAGHDASTGNYDLLFSTIATTPDSVGSFANPVPIAISSANGSSSTSGTIDFTAKANSSAVLGDYDVYSFVAPATGSLTVRMTPMSGNLKTHTYVYDASTNPPTWLDDSTGDVQVDVIQNNTYDITAAGVGLTAGNYVLQTFYPSYMGINDPALGGLVKQLFIRDGMITRADMIQILDFTVNNANSMLSPMDFADLRTIVNQDATYFKMPNYVKVLAGDIVNPNTANTYFTGGALVPQLLGNLQAGSTAAQMDLLVGKWFLGTDMPVPDMDDMNDAIPCTYTAVSGFLYGVNGVGQANGTPQLTDTEQGAYLGDCYFLSSMVSIANVDPTAIKNMIFANGDGTWTVRFYNNGVASYVTVNDELPVATQAQTIAPTWTIPVNGLIFDGSITTPNPKNPTNVLWLPLLEKAYAQWNELGYEGHGDAQGDGVNDDGVNSYGDIAAGLSQPVYDQVLGSLDASKSYFTDNETGIGTTEANVLSALSSNLAVTIGSVPENYPGPGASSWTPDKLIYEGHMYALVSDTYNPVTGYMFTVHNPWGIEPPQPGGPATQPPPLTWAEVTADFDYLATANPTATNAQTFSSSGATSIGATVKPKAARPNFVFRDAGGDPAAAAASAWLAEGGSAASSKNDVPRPAVNDLALMAYIN